MTAPTRQETAMNTYVFSYRAPKGYRPDPARTTPSWFRWFDELGDHVSDIGRRVGARGALGTVTADATELGGYSVVVAADLDDALRLAAGCPFLSQGGGIEVGELVEVPAPVTTA
jgi:hypothetical protein